MMLSDSNPEARRVHYRSLAALSREERVSIAMNLANSADDLLRAAVRRRFPDADEEELAHPLSRARYGLELAPRVYGG